MLISTVYYDSDVCKTIRLFHQTLFYYGWFQCVQDEPAEGGSGGSSAGDSQCDEEDHINMAVCKSLNFLNDSDACRMRAQK